MATALHNIGTVKGRTSLYQNRFSTLQDLEEFPPLENTGSTKKGPTGTNCTTYKQDLPNANANMAKRTSSTNKTSIEAKENQLKELERRVAQLKVEIENDKQEEERAKQRRQTELEKKKQDAIKKSVEQTMVLIPSFTKNPTPSENPPICAVTQATQSGNWEEKVLRFVETQAQQTQQTQQMLHQQIQQQIQQQQQMQQMMQQFQIMFMQFQKSQVQQCSVEGTSP
ncbi:transcription factor sma-9-like [Ixodes scapularis]|uniref:transcription factor sma-9-like n=1 Tax=Ixodes scapularis TaxID=6945 RepID=UPI001A9F7823|nr:transcription factor sma-9-like [Ixodes scapularis]